MRRLGPEVRRAHLRVSRDLGEAPLGDLPAVVERDDALAHALDDEHVVLDDDHREPGHLVADDAEVMHQLRRLLRVHPGRRLVEQEQPGPGGERAADLDAPPVDLRELAHPLEAAPRPERTVSALKSVVFAEAFGPITPTVSPSATTTSTPSRATSPPKRTVSPVTSSRLGAALTGIAGSARARGRGDGRGA